MRYTDRDLAYWGELGEVGIEEHAVAHARHWPDDTSGEACRRRHRLYNAAGIVSSSPHPLSYTSTRGGRPTYVHRLLPFGADLVYQHTGTMPTRIARGDPLKPDTLRHRLAVATMHLAVNDACRHFTLPRPTWILEQDTNPLASPEAPFTERFVLYELFKTSEKAAVSCRPDASTWLRIPAATPAAFLDLLVYWEVDRSTETLTRVARKLDGYQLLLQTQTFRRHWPAVAAPTVRLFFVVPSAERLTHIASAIREHPVRDAVRLVLASALTPPQLLTAEIWQTPTGDKRRLWTPSSAA